MSPLRHDARHDGGPPQPRLPLQRAGDEIGIGAGDANANDRPDDRVWSGEAPNATLSVVVPAKNEAPGLPELVRQIAEALRPLAARDAAPGPGGKLLGFEILVIDDGSDDDTPAVLRDLRREYPELRPVRLSRNVGQSAAIARGFRLARGQWIGTLDADLQNDPADFPALWDALPGHDAALGWRANRRDVWSKRVTGKCANRVRNLVLGQEIKDTGCALRLFPREAALRLPLFHGVHRFFGPLLIREGCRIVQVPVNHRARPHGRSHYSFRNRSFKVLFDLLGVAWLMRRPIPHVEAIDIPADARAGVETRSGVGTDPRPLVPAASEARP